MKCPRCDKPTRKIEVQAATVYVCPCGHTTEQPRLFPREVVNQGLQGSLQL